ncbi:MAG: hypothetical protein JRI89_09280 [Deltaproteobacteria bacterium]|nr:hypothetical protein [Deltaproteobacteria bacterium]
MRKLKATIRQRIAAQDDQWVQAAESLAQSLWNSLEKSERKDGKVGQLRNILDIAESSDSWEALKLFIRYQAARGQLGKKKGRQWAEGTIQQLEALHNKAQAIADSEPGVDPKVVHIEIVSRVLGYAVRWHVWDVKGAGQ